MKKLYPLLSVLFLIYWGCEDPKEEDTEKPTVTITSPQDGSTVYEIITITCMSSDNEGVDKVELWVNGVTTGLTDNSEPYSFEWNTTTLEDGNYTIIIRSYDTNENTTDSDPVILTVDNTLSIPTPVELYPITYNDGFQISWSQNNDDDFQSYKVYESLSQDMSNDTLIYETDNRTDTTFIKTLQNFRYYQIVVEDVWGFKSTSNIEFGDYYIELWGEFYSLLNTDSLILFNSGLSGEIPPEIGNLTNLIFLYLNNNQLTGSIPSEIGNLTNLEELWLYGNQLTGEIPSEIGNLTNLTILDLGGNNLTGSIPSEIGNLTNLTTLRLDDNQLTGVIPESICYLDINWGSTNYFNITNNKLCPPYPSCIEEYVGEQDLSNCEGDFVELWGEYYSIEYTTELDLSNSGLTGEIPPEIGNLTNLNYLWLNDNQLSGLIPESICDLTLNLSSNSSFRIYNNQLCPTYPSCIEDYVGEQDTSGCD